MKEILDKISSYNFFNYLLPGVLFVAFAKQATSHDFFQDNILIGAFVYYFIGLLISRTGSLILEPGFKLIFNIKFAPYGDYISVSKKDPKLEILSEANNMYRTLSSLFMLLALLRIYDSLAMQFPILVSLSFWIIVGVLFILFIFSYKKQTLYIIKRIKAGKSENL